METSTATSKLYIPIKEYTTAALEEFNLISKERKKGLGKLAQYIEHKRKAGEKVKLVFICTHNSRRSHLCQVWAQTAAYYYGINEVATYSGGTVATAFNPKAVRALTNIGFRIEQSSNGVNPIYLVKFTDERPPIRAFSKVYDEKGNPNHNFAAIMTCADADENCPFIPGVTLRLALPFDDPKDFDYTPQEETMYAQRTRQIAREILYVFSQVK